MPDTGFPDASHHAFFFDFDGTLVEIAARPDEVSVEARVRHALTVLARAADGALAIVTGRDVDIIDGFLAPLKLPVAGVHGLVRRDGRGMVSTPALDLTALRAVEEAAQALAAREPGLIVERKTGSVAIHYRARPELGDLCVGALEHAAAGSTGIVMKPGKMVIEAHAAGADKGRAIASFMEEPPFAGRVPVFVGDDVTDEDGFRVVNALGGRGIRIGPGPTLAGERMADTAAFLGWLETYAQHLEHEEEGKQAP